MKNKVWAAAAWLSIALLLGGCSLFKPQPKPSAGPEPQITVYMHETGEKKTMGMEEYVAGVVAGEMKNDWPVAALAAQAIIARTYTLEAMETKGGVPARGTNASTDIKEFQAYNAAQINDNVRQAVDMTRGMVITYQGKVVKPWFHASAGGITALAKEGLNYKEAEPAYIQSVQSPDDLAPADVQNWSATLTKQEVLAALAKMGQKLERIDSVEIGQKGPSGRTTDLVFNKNTLVNGPDFRVQAGGTKLKSMLLDQVNVSGDNVTFAGKGYGHGVGLSQWGANKMARDGSKPEDIIAHYFKGVTIDKRWQ